MSLKYSIKIVALLLLVLSGCSRNDADNVFPIISDYPSDSNTHPILDLPLPISTTGENSTNRILLGSWSCTFDLKTLNVDLKSEKNVSAHFNVTSFVPNPSFVINSYDPQKGIIDVDVTITNPSNVTAYDVRLIIYTDNIGHKLLNADDWTSLFDIPSGYPINPFKAYAKDKPVRKFAGQTQNTENLKIKLPGGNPNIRFAIDASYPENCVEPYEISGFAQDYLFDYVGASSEIEVNVFDWYHDVNAVQLYCPAITGVTLVPFNQATTENWQMEIVNNTGALSGDYTGYIVATSDNSGSLALYDEVAIEVIAYDSQGWARTWGDITNEGSAFLYGVDVYNDELIGVVGHFMGTVDFDPGLGVVEKTASSDYGEVFVSLFDLHGIFQSVFTFGSGSQSLIQGIRIAFNSSGYIYIMGNFYGTKDFDPSSTVVNKTSNGDSDIFCAKYSTSGILYWVRTWGGSQHDYCLGLGIDQSSYPYVAGYFQGTVDFDPSVGIEERTSNGYYDCFVSKFNGGGVFQWVNTWGGSYASNNCIALDMDNYDNLYITGFFGGLADFDPGSGSAERYAVGLDDAFLVKYTKNGDFISVNTWGGGYSQTMGHGVCVDNDGNSYVFGEYDDIVDFDPGPGVNEHNPSTDGFWFLSKFNSSDTYEWVRTFGVEYYDNYVRWYIEASNDGGIYVTGSFKDTVDFDPGPGVMPITSNGYDDFFVSKFLSNGDFIWVRTWGDANSDGSYCVTTDSSGDIYPVGDFIGTIDFDPGSGIDEHSSPPSGYASFLIRLKPDGYW